MKDTTVNMVNTDRDLYNRTMVEQIMIIKNDKEESKCPVGVPNNMKGTMMKEGRNLSFITNFKTSNKLKKNSVS